MKSLTAPKQRRPHAGAFMSAGCPLEELARTLVEDGAAFRCDEAFNRAALDLHDFQRQASPVLRRFWDAAAGGRGAGVTDGGGEGGLPDREDGGGARGRAGGPTGRAPFSWTDIPPVPVDAFKDVAILCGGPAQAVFRTSGTSLGAGRRGEHHVASLALYRAAARANYRRHLFAGAERLGILALVPSPQRAPDSSLSAMAGFMAEEPEIAGSTWAFDPELGIDMDAVAEAAAGTAPLLVLTTAFSLVHLLDRLGDSPLSLPAGSRIMETGGFKGRAAKVDRATLYGRVGSLLGVPAASIVNEYGMTEMLSQAYDGQAGRASAAGERVHRFPPWVRTRALAPGDLRPLPPGEPGLLAHFDLANAGSVCHILTGDLGCTTTGGGVRLLGRAPGTAVRGCSLTAESFLRAARRP